MVVVVVVVAVVVVVVAAVAAVAAAAGGEGGVVVVNDLVSKLRKWHADCQADAVYREARADVLSLVDSTV